MGVKWGWGRGVISVFALCMTVFDAQADSLKCEGPFAKDTSHKRLVEAFGPSNVTLESIYGAEGIEMKASVIFPADHERRVEVMWWDEESRSRPSFIQVAGTGWTGTQGVRVGMSLSEVEAINGKPFSLYGFSWDYGGTAVDWKKGRLAEALGGCTLRVVFAPDENTSEAALNRVGGDTVFSSSSKGMRAVKPRVQRLSVGYPE
ncbi:hypothetical protein MHY87_13355 [Microvirga sp. ACRRW]|uniref:hypothetical protein n=1 Tax=Microvirga sp. ACRRW TaxID=2918205 RepID=UPI001EF6CD1B|nr:hypothetical protein [Microvirga sp. ACRRW]MCG7393892.1 hypothetical protein [Microvirga sp. ACRRW]